MLIPGAGDLLGGFKKNIKGILGFILGYGLLRILSEKYRSKHPD